MTLPALTLIQGARLYAPEPLGVQDLLLAGSGIAAIAPAFNLTGAPVRLVDGRGLLAVPGFIDNHVHLLGGGGEGGFHTRTPELRLGDALQAGITTVLGCLGTDGVTRSLAALLAKARSLEEQGLTTFLLTGSYGVPPVTLTGSVERDLILIDKFIGVGEVAISDHRSSQPSLAELARLAGDARRGGMLAGKAGIVNLHLGDGNRGLEPLTQLIQETELPVTQFLPTHVNRNPRVFEQAIRFAKAGGTVDITTSGVPRFYETGTLPPAEALRLLLGAGVPAGNITLSSDGQGSLPVFAEDGTLEGLTVGSVQSLHTVFCEAVQRQRVPLETALAAITANPARILKLAQHGRIAPGLAADVVLLDPDSLAVRGVVAGGRVLMEDGALLVRGTFE
jgi:beta-aspartyl-dipeptidase (metallo-type)